MVAAVTGWLRGRRHQGEELVTPLQIPPPDDAKPTVPVAYMPLYVYLDHRHATTVILTFEQIETLLGFAPPMAAFADVAWWTGSCGTNDRHAAAWIAARRSAAPRLKARVVAFERFP